MSRRFRWLPARAEPADEPVSSKEPTTETPPWWSGLPAGPAVSGLLELAERRETGALEFSSEPGGSVYLTDGAVSQVVCPAVPHVAERVLRRVEPTPRRGESRNARALAEVALREGVLSRVQVHALLVDAAADAALELVGGGPGTRFAPGRQHWAPLVWPLPVNELLTEIARRRQVLAAVADQAQPDAPARRVERLPVQRIRLTARQWDLVRLADGATPRAMAHALAAGVFATTLEVAALVQAGVLAPVDTRRDARTPMPFLRAASS